MKKKNLIAILFILSFSKSNLTRKLRYYFQMKLYREHGLFICFTSHCFHNLFTVKLNKICVKVLTGERIFIDELVIKINPQHLFSKNVFKCLISPININKVFISNSRKILTSTNKNEPQNSSASKYLFEKRIYNAFKKHLSLIFAEKNPEIEIAELRVSVWLKARRLDVNIKNIHVGKFMIKGSSIVSFENLDIVVPFQIKMDASNREIVFHNNGALILNRTTKLEIAKLKRLEFVYRDIDSYNFVINSNINSLELNNEAISNGIVVLEKVTANFKVKLNSESFEILKESIISVNDICLSLNLLHSFKEPDLITISILLVLEGNNFFQNYPFILKGINKLKAEGDLILQLDFMTSLQDFSKYYFNCTVLEDSLTILDIEEFSLTDLCHELNLNLIIPTIINSTLLNKTSDISYCSDIPEHIKNIIVLTEDPNFYTHKGIDPYFIGIAIAVNLTNKKFIKGASTITMQLVRNLFLNHNKCISRKLDELIIAWLLENHFKIPKIRILDLYLNIIEFGNKVFGIKDASKYYFDKDLSSLSLTELFVLSYIIPRPKYFLEAVLIDSPKLKINLRRHIASYASKLLRLKKISDEEFMQLDYCISFKSKIGVLQL